MDIFMKIVLFLIIITIILVALAVILKRNTGTNIKDTLSETFAVTKTEGFAIPIESISDLSVKEERDLVEITDKTVIARINQTLPTVADKVAKSLTKSTFKNAEIYRAVIPSGKTLENSKGMKDAFRGFYKEGNKIKGQANFVKVDPTKISKASKVANIGANALNLSSLVVGQYYMSEINSKLETMNKNISKISDFQEKEFKSRIISLISLVAEVSQFSTEIIENDELRIQKLQVLENKKADATELLTQVNEMILSFSQSNSKPNYKEYEKLVENFTLLVEYQNILMGTLEEISKLMYLLGKGGISSELCYTTYKKHWGISVQVRGELEGWHKCQVETLKIDLNNNRRYKSGFEGFVVHIPGMIDDKLKYKLLDPGLVEKINSQTQSKPNRINESGSVYNNDVQIIIKDGKYYYLPDVFERSEDHKE